MLNPPGENNFRETARKPSKYYLFAFLIIMLGGFLRFFMLGDKSLWLDEGASLDYSDGSNAQAILSTIMSSGSGDRYQPLYYVLLFFWRQVFGNSEFAVRSLSAFLGVGAIVVLFYTALRLYGKKHAIWLALFLSVSSYAVYYSQQTRAYSLLLFLAALQLYFFSTALNERQIRGEVISRWMFWIVTAFSLFCSILIGIFTLSLCLSYILVYRNLKRSLQWWLPAALFCLPAVIFYLTSPGTSDPTKINVTLSKQSVIQNFVFVLYGLLVGETYATPLEQLRSGNKTQVLLSYLPQFLILLVVISVLLISIIVGAFQINDKKYQKLDKFFASLLIVSLLLAAAFAILTKLNWLPRHSFYIYLPLAFLIPLGIRYQPKNKNQKNRVLHYARFAVIALLILNIYSLSNYYFNQDYQREDYRLVARYLVANQSPSVKSVLLYGAPNLLPYYGDTLTLNGLGLDTSNLAQQVRSLTNDADKVIIAISYQSFWESRNNFSIEQGMKELYKLESKTTFTNFNIYHFVKQKIK